ncbi:hypothetical protein HYC85_023008 [Camellia sinensis]|uniref:Conserved oligomeric Golgi complex subunit 6 n=1 Tax=Camellia sinensis TaxID=4442 RepID=A0A7J7GD95_CAMSI|nr:hypothetical protein HYC85_023008 [Camellia sinensis]
MRRKERENQREEDLYLLASLNTLFSFHTDNNPQVRRNLQSTIEKHSLSINLEFLFASDATQQALDRVEEEVNSLVEEDFRLKLCKNWSLGFDLDSYTIDLEEIGGRERCIQEEEQRGRER